MERLDVGDTEGVRALLDGVPAADVATLLEDLDDDEQAAVFGLLDADSGADVLDELPPDDVQDLAEAAPIRVRDAVEAMEPDEAVDILQALGDEQAEALLEGLSAERASEAEQLSTYPPDSAGGLMTTEFVLLFGGVTAGEAIGITQQSREAETVGPLYVADEDDRLVGHLPLQRLVFAPPDTLVADLMEEDVHAAQAETDQEDLVRAATRYDMGAVPVVDGAGRLIGVVTLDDILEAAEEEADEDMYRLAGTGERDPVHASVGRSTRLRLPWLLLSVVDGLFIAFVLSRFDGTLRMVAGLVFFIPLIPLMGGQVAIQSSTIIVRGLAVGDFRRGMIARFLRKQLAITVLLALCCGVATGVLGTFVVGQGPQLMLAVGLAVGCAILVSGTLGMTFPLLFNRIGIDPAVSSGPFITMLNDLICIFIYLVLAMLLAA